MRTTVLGILLLTSISCSQLSATSNNVEIVEMYFLEVWNKRDYNELNLIWDDTVKFNLGSNSFNVSPTKMIDIIDGWFDAFPDFKFKTYQIIADDDIVAINLNYSGTHRKKFMGIEPQNNTIEVSMMVFIKLDDGKIVELWELYDNSGMEMQMSAKN